MIAVVIFVAALLLFVVGTHDDSPAKVRTIAPVALDKGGPPTHAPVAHTSKAKPKATPRATTKPATIETTPPATAPARTTVTNTAAPVTSPPVVKHSPIGALQWTAPSTITMKRGTEKTITVSVHNPTDGVVTLGVPLSCAPRLQNDGICPQVAQLVQPGTTASATYTIDANGVAPGNYTLTIEGVWKIRVTVTTPDGAGG